MRPRPRYADREIRPVERAAHCSALAQLTIHVRHKGGKKICLSPYLLLFWDVMWLVWPPRGECDMVMTGADHGDTGVIPRAAPATQWKLFRALYPGSRVNWCK